MTNRALFLIGLLGSVVMTGVGLLICQAAQPGPTAPASPVSNTETAPISTPATELAATIAARPLFDPSRRGSGGSGVTAAVGLIGLPHLSGTMITPTERRAFFVGDNQAGSLSQTEGGMVGTWRIESIVTGQVTLAGPEGRRVLRTGFSDSRQNQPSEASQ